MVVAGEKLEGGEVRIRQRARGARKTLADFELVEPAMRNEWPGIGVEGLGHVSEVRLRAEIEAAAWRAFFGGLEAFCGSCRIGLQHRAHALLLGSDRTLKRGDAR